MKSARETALHQVWDNPDEDLLREIRSTVWTAHNIPLTRSVSTMDNSIPLIMDDRRTRLVRDSLYTPIGKDLSGVRLLDLGCLEGGLSFAMACEGMNVLGVEGRSSNYAKCLLIKKYYRNLHNLRFALLDVKELNRGRHGVFDIVLRPALSLG